MDKYPKALLVNDIHIDRDNIEEFRKNWDEMISVCREKGVKEVIMGGDMFTNRSSQTLPVLAAVRAALDKADNEGISVILAEGNHDKVRQEDTGGYCHIFSGVSKTMVVDSHIVIPLECGRCLIVMSYFPEDGSFLTRLDEAAKKSGYEKDSIVLYIHEGVHGALGDFEIPGELPQEPLLDFRSVLCGHYHNRTRIKGTNIQYIGSSRQHNFGEDEEKGYTLLWSDGSTEFVKNAANTRYRTVTIGAEEADGCKFEADARYKTRVKVRCTDKEAGDVDRQRLLDMGFDKVEVVNTDKTADNVEASSLDEKYDKDGIRREYRLFCADKGIDPELGDNYLKRIG